MAKFLVLGDIHIGKGLSMGRTAVGSGYNSRVIDQIELLDWVLQQAIDNGVEAIIATGDICEEAKPDYKFVKIFIDWLMDCSRNGIHVYIVCGNHDITRTGHFIESYLDIIELAEIPNVFFHKDITTIHFDDTSVTLMPYRDLRLMELPTNKEAVDNYQYQMLLENSTIPVTHTKVLVGHLALEGSLYVGDEIDDSMNELIFPVEAFKNYDYVWMGHVHKPQVRCKTPHIAHIGSLDLSDFGETDHNKIIIIFDSESKGKFTEIVVPSRPLKKFIIEIPEGKDPTEHVISAIEEYCESYPLKNALVKLEIKLGTSTEKTDKSKIEKKLKELGVYHLSNYSESRQLTVISADKKVEIDNTTDPKSAIKLWAEHRKLDEEVKALYINFASDILEKFKAKH